MAEIFNINKNQKKPLHIRKPKPTFRTTYEKEHYWDSQRKLWIEGNGILTGEHIFYLDQCKIKDIYGGMQHPKWREVDQDFFDSWKKTRDDKWDMLLVKRREIGFSCVLSALLIHTMLMNPGSESLYTSADEDRRKVLFSEKIIPTFDSLDDDIRPDKARMKQQGNLFLAKEDRATKTFSGLKSRLTGLDSVKNPTSFEAHRALLIAFDEFFLMPKSRKAKASANRCMVRGTEKVGSIIMGGTAGDQTIEGAREGLTMFKSSKELRITNLFLGGDRGFDAYMTNGWDDREAAKEWNLRERERLGKAEDKTDYFKHITDYPLSVEEVFNLVTDCVLPQTVQMTLMEAEQNIDREGVKPGKYTIITNGQVIKANPDELKGKVNIVKPPVQGHSYVAGTDPIPFGNNALGEGSDYSIVIMDNDTKEIVADYTERNLDSQEVVANSILLQKLYYRAPTMLELTRGEVVLKEYLALGEQNLLAPMPTHLGIIWEERKYPYGSSMNNQIASRCENLVMKFLLAHAYKLRHRRFIHEVRRLGTKANTDVLDAVKMCLLYMAEIDEVNKLSTYAPVQHKTVKLVRNMQTGKIDRKLVTSELIR